MSIDKIDKKDYEEPTCPMDNSMWVENKVTPIPVSRIIEKLDEHLDKKDFKAALRHLEYWYQEALVGHDDRGRLVLCNEFMGFYRKNGEKELAIKYSDEALKLVNELDLLETTSGAMAYLNSGTVYKVFNDPHKSIECFTKTLNIFNKVLKPNDERFAGLYNNMALTLVDLKKYEEAKDLYLKAIEITKLYNHMDEAITYLNLVDLIVLEKGMEKAEVEISQYLDQAEELLDNIPVDKQNGYYAYVCEKCAPIFDYYGYFMAAKKFSEAAKKIYGEC